MYVTEKLDKIDRNGCREVGVYILRTVCDGCGQRDENGASPSMSGKLVGWPGLLLGTSALVVRRFWGKQRFSPSNSHCRTDGQTLLEEIVAHCTRRLPTA
jgi:hypothetical protein